jgi:hypothetical protein
MHLLHWIVLLYTTWLALMHHCDPPCTRTYQRILDLTSHQHSCPVHHAIVQATGRRLCEVAEGSRLGVKELSPVLLNENINQSEVRCCIWNSNSFLIDPHIQDVAPVTISSIPTDPPLTASGHPRRNYRWPKRYHHSPPPPQPQPNILSAPVSANPGPTFPTPHVERTHSTFTTEHNGFRVFRSYPDRPSYDPDDVVPDPELTRFPMGNSSIHGEPPPHDPPPPAIQKPWSAPFSSASSFLLINWMHGNHGSNIKSTSEVQGLVDNASGNATFPGGTC